MKTCSRCQQSKPFEAFSVKRANKDGYAYRCKACRKELRGKPVQPKAPKPPKPPQVKHASQPQPTLSPAGTCHQKVRRDATEAEDRELGCRFDLQVSDFVLTQERMTKEHIAFIERYE